MPKFYKTHQKLVINCLYLDIDKRIEESIRANRQKQQQSVFQRAKAQKNEPLETSFQAKNTSTSR